jgi:hypothetical protein
LNPRTPAGPDPESGAFGQARQPPLTVDNLIDLTFSYSIPNKTVGTIIMILHLSL